MLAWLVAAAAPLIIHLLSRRRYRETEWAAMQYLLAAVRKNARRIRIEQWLLLAVRTALVVLVVLALAEPYLTQAGLKLMSGGRTHKVLVLDASFSMAVKHNDKTRFQRALELASRVVTESSQGDGFTLVLLASPPRVVVGTPVFERHDFLQELEKVHVLDADADLPGTLAKVEEVLSAAHREYSRLSRDEVYFLTDLGRNTWVPDVRGAGGLAEFRGRGERLAASANVIVADLGEDGAENIAVTALRPLEPYITVARDTPLEVELHNFGRQARVRQVVELFVDGRRAGETRVDLAAGGSATTVLNYRFDAPGDHSVEIRAAGDSLDVDNHRWLALPVVNHLRVLCINGKPAGGDFQGATDYLLVALSPNGPTDERSVIRPEVVTERALLETDLSLYDCVLLCNVAQFTTGEARVLEAYVRGGGGLVMFLGDQVRTENYNRFLAGEKDGVDLLAARLGDAMPVHREEPYLFNALAYRHPIVAPFRGRDRAGLLTAPTYEYVKLQPHEAAKVALAFTTGDPAIVERQIGPGRTIVVATSADTSWTGWPMWPSYVPIVQELVAAAVRGRLDERSLMVGQPLSRSIAGAGGELVVTVEPPDQEPQTIRAAVSDGSAQWTFAGVDRGGLYAVDLGPPLIRRELFAANVDTTESDLSRVSLEELRDDVWPGVNFESLDGRVAVEESGSAIVRSQPVHQWLLYGALALLLAETALASWLGRKAV